MRINEYDITLNRKLFGLDRISNNEDINLQERIDLAKATVKRYGEEIVALAWYDYLEQITTEEEARIFILVLSKCGFAGWPVSARR